MRQYLFIFLSFALFQSCWASGEVVFYPMKYINPGGKLATGKCCDQPSFSWCPLARKCDHSFFFCLDEPNGSRSDIRQCRIGNYSTEIFLNTNEHGFDINHTAHLRFSTWLGGMLLKVKVTDYIRSNKRYALVELLSTEVWMEAANTRGESQVTNFQAKQRTQLDFKMAVFCDENWYGPKCDVNCESSNIDLVHYNSTSDRPKKCQAVEPRNTSETALPQIISSLSDRDYINDNNTDTCMMVSSQHGGSFLTLEIHQKPPLQIILKLKAVPSCEQSNLFVFTPNMVQCPLTNSTTQNGTSSCVYSCIDKCSNRVTVGFQKAKFDPQSWQICEVAEIRNPNGLMTSCC